MDADTAVQLRDLSERVRRLEEEIAGRGKSIEAENFRVVGPNGKVMATLGFEWAGGRQDFPSLELRHDRSKACLSIGMTPAGPSISFFDERSVQRINLSCPFGDGPGLDFHDERQTLRARFGVTPHGPGLSLNSAVGQVGTILLLSNDGPVMEMLDSKQEVIWSAPS